MAISPHPIYEPSAGDISSLLDLADFLLQSEQYLAVRRIIDALPFLDGIEDDEVERKLRHLRADLADRLDVERTLTRFDDVDLTLIRSAES